ncbi:MAG: hypothetical protein QE271_04980 [Bacteriovoracaceae bacterium]|nr:hypothetical protein [Bacteriovoracaceae bacterium]
MLKFLVLKFFSLFFIYLFVNSNVQAQFIYPNNYNEARADQLYYLNTGLIVNPESELLSKDGSLVTEPIEVSFWSDVKNYFFFELHKGRAANFVNNKLLNNKLLNNPNVSNIRMYSYEDGSGFHYECKDPYGYSHWYQFLKENAYVTRKSPTFENPDHTQHVEVKNIDLDIVDFANRASEYGIKCPSEIPINRAANGGVVLVIWNDENNNEWKSVFRSYSNKGIFIWSDLFSRSDYDSLKLPLTNMAIDQYGFPILLYSDLAVPVYDAPAIGQGGVVVKSSLQVVTKASKETSKTQLARNLVLAVRESTKYSARFSKIIKLFSLGDDAAHWVKGFRISKRLKQHLTTVDQLINETNIVKVLTRGVSGAHTRTAFETAIDTISRIPGVVLKSKNEIPLKEFIKDGKVFAHQVICKFKMGGRDFEIKKTIYNIGSGAGQITLDEMLDLSLAAANAVLKTGKKIGDVVVDLNGKKFMGKISEAEGLVETVFAIP